MLRFCNKPITKEELIEKTLSTFPVYAIVLSKQYRTDFNAGRITRFNELINILSVSEKHDNILIKNYNSRLVGTKSVREANYSAPKRERKERYPNNRGYEGQMGTYNRSNKEGNRNFRAGTRDGNSTRGRSGYGNTMGRGSSTMSRGGNMGRGGRRIRRGSSSRNPPREYPQNLCKASDQLVAKYRAYRDLREQEVYLAEDENGEDVNLTIEDFKAIDEEHKDAADFD
ncbi:uncharacterized protein LOC133737949 [Rosa rugosa]|uniref:uncharacterized protein LOC133737949 n=1 Tax=Rosa rugosa TaxID=74645 RepID=UPI002B413D8E|nr:uncharacterized protein LOC133737949 [Rosa rugosa]